MTNKLQVNRSYFFELLIYMIWIQTILMQYVRSALMKTPYISAFPDLIIFICYLVVIGFSILEFELDGKDLIFFLSCAFVLIVERFTRGRDNPYLEVYVPRFLFQTLSLYLVGVALVQHEKEQQIIDNLYLLSVLTIIINFLYKVVFGTPMDAIMSQFQGDMNLAYNILPHCCLVAFYAKNKPNIVNIFLTWLSALYLLMLGTRGAVLFYFVCVAWILILGKDVKKTTIMIVLLTVAIGTFILSPLYKTTILFMYECAQKLGMSTRIFDKLLAGVQFGSSGRNILAKQLMVSIKNHPILGTGLCSDRLVIGVYAHNVVLELWTDFGVFIGSFLCGCIMYLVVQGLLKSLQLEEKGLIITLVCSTLFKLLLSSTYLDSALLFLLLGLCVGVIRKTEIQSSIIARYETCY